MTPGGLEPSSPDFHSMDTISHAIKVTGSWEDMRRTTITLPDIVLKYLKLASAAQDRKMYDMVLEAVVEYYGLKKSAS